MPHSPRVVSTIKEEDEDEYNDPEESVLWEEIIPQNDDDDDDGIDTIEDVTKETFTQGFHKLGKQYIPGRGFSRYNASLRNFILIRGRKKKKASMGIDDVGLLSFATFSWLSSLIYKAYKKALTLDDIPDPSPYDTSEYNAQRLEMMWQNELTKKGPQSASLELVTWRFIRTRILIASLIYILYIASCFISIAFCMRGLLEYIESEDDSIFVGVKWAALLTIVEFIRVTCYSMVWGINSRTAIRLRSACMAVLYRKLLRLNNLGNTPIKNYVDLFAVDAETIFRSLTFLPMLIGGPISMILCLSYTYWQLSAWATLGMCILFLFYPIQYGLSTLSGYIKSKAMPVRDERGRATTELLESIKVIKLNAWEFCFTKKVFDIRKKELSLVKKNALCQSLESSMSSTAPIVTAIYTFLVHIAAGYGLTASQAFTVLAFCLKLLKGVLINTRDGFRSIKNLKIALQRMKDVLILNETKVFFSRSLDKSQAISIANADFVRQPQEEIQFEDNKKRKNQSKKKSANVSEHEIVKLSPVPVTDLLQDVLTDINFFAPKGKLIGICGEVGSGKSTLLSAIMGQVSMSKGTICKSGSFAYVSQEPWLLNATLKDNILFGEHFVAKRYINSIYCCSLNEDINLLPGGDDTEIGERGVNLSGGQKQRVALARALYADRDIYLLDDPLSSVDAQVKDEIFKKYIKGALKQKTILLVSHNLQFLKECDDIVVMKGGCIVERGTFDELFAENGEFKVLIGSCLKFEENNSRSCKINTNIIKENMNTTKSDKSSENSIKPITQESGGNSDGKGILIRTGKVQTGTVRFQTILSYLKASGGFIISTILLLISFINISSTAFSSWWLALWLKAGSGNTSVQINNITEISTDIADNPEFSMYYLVYSLSIIVILTTDLIRGFCFTKVAIRASSLIYKQLFNKVLKSPLHFFERTPIGHLQNLFSRDIADIQAKLPDKLEIMVCGIWQLAFAVFFICLVFPYFVLPIIFLAIVFYFISRIFRAGIRDFKNLESLSLTLVLSVVSSTLHGLCTIHAHEKEKDFIRKFNATLDQNSSCSFLQSVGDRWLAVRLDALAVLVTTITAAFVIIFHDEVAPSMAGLALAYAATISGLFQFTVRQHCECESSFLSLERINKQINGLEQEGGHGPKGIPPDSWPELGTIRFSHVCLRYHSDLPFVLNDISFKVRPYEKIGIIGRTGSGKSSLLSAIFRLVNVTNGNIKVDNLDISTLDVNILRNRLTVVPQEPVLFSSTIRINLDPTETCTDDEIWSALEKTQLKDKVSSNVGKLEMIVSHKGDNFSTGEKQLLCLARALLKKSKIVVFDEATSGIDPETEKAIQKIILEEFKLCTVLTIAHRLETVMSCDRILVMDKGQIVEFDAPSALSCNENSAFSRMLSASNNEGLMASEK